MKNYDGLIGYSGFVGSTLRRQRYFERCYRSSNIDEIQGENFDLLVCAGAPAQKWLANEDPLADFKKIEELICRLRKITCNHFVLISTVDVFREPLRVNESTPVDKVDLHPYGLNRRYLEEFVQSHFERHTIVRLPGLVGPGLKKNVIYDFLHHNNLAAIDSRSVFQFYPMVNLWFDIKQAMLAKLSIIHLTAEGLSVSDIALGCFGAAFDQHQSNEPVVYDMRTQYSAIFGSAIEGYQYSARESYQAIRAYAQSEISGRQMLPNYKL